MEKQQRILVVDNDPFERINCRVMLRGIEFVVFFGEDRGSAIERVAKEEFQLIMTNIRLPNKHAGLTFVQELKSVRPKAEIVVMADSPSIWDAREAVRLGASGYIERPFTAECVVNVARKTFDNKGWIVRKAHIDQFRDYIVPSPEVDSPAIYYKDGSWARHLEAGIWEVGYDMKYWLPSGRQKNSAWTAFLEGGLREVEYDMTSPFPYHQNLSITLSKGLSTLVAGEPYARVLSSTGRSYRLAAPMTGIVKEVNTEANYIMKSLVPEDLGTDWLLWLARIQTKEVENSNFQDIEEGRVIGTYCMV